MDKETESLLKELFNLFSNHINKNHVKQEDIWWNNLKRKHKKVIYNKHR